MHSVPAPKCAGTESTGAEFHGPPVQCTSVQCCSVPAPTNRHLTGPQRAVEPTLGTIASKVILADDNIHNFQAHNTKVVLAKNL